MSVRLDGGEAYALLSIAVASVVSCLVITGGGRKDWYAKAMAFPSMSFVALAVSDAVPLLRASARPFSISTLGCLSLGLWNVLFFLRTLGAPFGRKRRPLQGERGPLRALFEKRGVSNREREILRCISEGCSNKQIADRLFISVSTVKTHVYHIFRKLKVETRFELLRTLQRLDPSAR